MSCRARVLTGILAVILLGSVACKSVSEPPPQVPPTASQQIVEDLERRLAELERELEQCRGTAEEGEARIAECLVHVAELEAALEEEALQRSAAEDELEHVMALSEDALAETLARSMELEAARAEGDREIALRGEEIDELSMVLSAFAALTVDEGAPPTLVDVFYATTRQRLDAGTSASAGSGPGSGPSDGQTAWSVRALVLPLVFLALFFALPPLFRTLLKERFQRGFVLTARVVCVLIFLVSGFVALRGLIALWSGGAEPLTAFTEERRLGGQPYELGTCVVSIPPTHLQGHVEDLAIWEVRRDPAKHFVLTETTPIERPDDFYAQLGERVKTSPGRNMFLYVHGYLNTFEDAAFRTAQIHHDLEFGGAPMFFSWPTGKKNYLVSENNWLLAAEALAELLDELLGRMEDDTTLHLLAHSMGSRVLTQAVRLLDREPDAGSFGELVLAAPDIDAQTFATLVPEVTQKARRVTLYASSRDAALQVSQLIHGGEPRAGQAPPDRVFAGVDTIDVSAVTSGHSYLGASGHILDDLAALLTGRRPLGALDASIARRECLPAAPTECYWVLR